jgi:hypothetical protein
LVIEVAAAFDIWTGAIARAGHTAAPFTELGRSLPALVAVGSERAGDDFCTPRRGTSA